MSRVPVWARWIAALLLVVALLLWLVLFAPAHFVPAPNEADLRTIDAARRLELQNDVRTTLLQGLGGLALILGAFFTYHQLQTGRRQLHVAQEAQVTERFTRAIDQLGHESLDVRLGGIHALERIARDSPDDKSTIGEVLTAYIRSHAPWPPTQPGQYVATAPIDEVRDLQVRAPDVHACLTVLGRGEFSTGLPHESLDLHAVDLRKAHLVYAVLQRTDLSDANLAGAHLMGVDMSWVLLDRANLAGADIVDSILMWADLFDANLEKANLAGTVLAANLGGANLSSARLHEATLDGADLHGAVADDRTEWPYAFDWVMAGVTLNRRSPAAQGRGGPGSEPTEPPSAASDSASRRVDLRRRRQGD